MSDDANRGSASDPIALAREAEALRRNAALGHVLDALDREQVSAWRDAETTEDREGAWYRLRAVEAVRASIERIIDAGKIAQRRQRGRS